MSDSVIYLDNHATTKVDPRVVEAMLPWMTENYGNASSIGHAPGGIALEAVDQARQTIAAAIGADPLEIVFTSGATESNNLAIRGVAERTKRRGDHLVSVKTEHNAVLAPLERLSNRGYQVELLDVKNQDSVDMGVVSVADLENHLGDQTCLVSVMLANNEIGVIQPIAEIGKACRERGVLLHSDATQAVGKIPVDVDNLSVDLMSFTAHKLHGPKGIGALYVRRRKPIVRLDPLIVGGGQERGRRGGTLNVPGIVGFAKAVEIACEEQQEESARLRDLRNHMFDLLKAKVDGIHLCGPELDATDSQGKQIRLSNNLNFHIEGVDGEAIMMQTPEFAFSSGAACSSADPEPSHVLQAIGLSADEARCTLRIGLSRFTTEEEITQAATAIEQAVQRLRNLT